MLIQRVSAERGLAWVAEGFRLFRGSPLLWIVNLLLFIAALSLLSMVPLIGTAAATLLQPVFVAGLLKGCHDLERGEDLRLEHLLAGFGRRAKPLLMLGLWLGLGYAAVAVVLIAALLGTGLFGSAAFHSAGWEVGVWQFPDQAVLISVLLAVNLGLLLSLPLAMASWFAPALVIFDELAALDALKASFVGCLRNVWPFLIYGAVLLLFLAVALVPFGLGLLVWLPMLFGSMYVSYKEIYRSVE